MAKPKKASKAKKPSAKSSPKPVALTKMDKAFDAVLTRGGWRRKVVSFLLLATGCALALQGADPGRIDLGYALIGMGAADFGLQGLGVFLNSRKK